MRDFFERQNAARRNSLLLVLYFLAAVALVVSLVSVAIYIMFTFKPVRLNFAATPFNLNWRDWDVATLGKIAGGVLFLILCGTAYKYSRLLSGGGSMIAETLGGRVIYPDTDDFYERRLLNIIEEMAIASGVTVPSVYFLAEERGINAFAAGFAQEDAVLGVTWGTLHYLTREELQGVIAHEFSHILSGDMLINIRLQGLLHGILVLGLLGETILRAAMTVTDESRNPKNSAAIGIGFGIGIILFILGYTGVFVGRLLKSAISRQREFLADAAAVQFTRNPMGLAGALKKIGGLDDGSRIRNPRAAEISHMYFGNGMAESWFSSFSTHPPLQERIKHLDPEFQGSYAEHIEPITPDREEALAYATFAGHQPGFGSPDTLPTEGHVDSLVAGEDLRKAMSRPSTAQMELARELIGALPGTVRNAVRNAFGARAVIYCLLLDPRQQVRQQQLAALKNDADPRVWHELSKLLPDITALRPEVRLPLVDIAMPSLKTLSESQYPVFLRNIKTLLASDGKIDLFEYSLQFVLLKHLRSHFDKPRRKLVPITSLTEIQDEISCILSQLARYGHDDEVAARKAMMRAIRFFAEQQRKYFNYLAEPLCSLENFDQALQRLNGASMPIKRQLLAAALECILWDSRITVREAELFRVVTEALDCPVPPWLTLEGANPRVQDTRCSPAATGGMTRKKPR